MMPISLLLPLQVSPDKLQQWPVLRETAILMEHGFDLHRLQQHTAGNAGGVLTISDEPRVGPRRSLI